MNKSRRSISRRSIGSPYVRLALEALEPRRMLDASVSTQYAWREDDFEVSGTWTFDYQEDLGSSTFHDVASGSYSFDGHLRYDNELTGTITLEALGSGFEIRGTGTAQFEGDEVIPCASYGIVHLGSVTLQDTDGQITPQGAGSPTDSQYTFYNEPRGDGTCPGDAEDSSPFGNSTLFSGEYDESSGNALSFSTTYQEGDATVTFSTPSASLDFDNDDDTDLALAWAPLIDGVHIKLAVSGKHMDSGGDRSRPVTTINAYYADSNGLPLGETPFDSGPIEVFWNNSEIDIFLTDLTFDVPQGATRIEVRVNESGSVDDADDLNNVLFIPLFDFAVTAFEGQPGTHNDELTLEYDVLLNPAGLTPTLDLEILGTATRELASPQVLSSFTLQEVAPNAQFTEGSHSVTFRRSGLGDEFADPDINFIQIAANRSGSVFDFNSDNNSAVYSGFFQSGGFASVRTASDGDDEVVVFGEGGLALAQWGPKSELFDSFSGLAVITSEGDDVIRADADYDSPLFAYGGSGSDVLIGGIADDVLIGDEGDDFLMGRAGMDTLDGGADKDVLLGEGFDVEDSFDSLVTPLQSILNSGTVTLEAGLLPLAGETDYLFGGPGDDLIIGGDGGDQIDAGAGNAVIFGDSFAVVTGINDFDVTDPWGGLSTLVGLWANFNLVGSGFDEITGGAGSNVIVGGGGGDMIHGGSGALDILFGNDGLDTIRGGDGKNFIVGGEGADQLYGGDDPNVIFGDSFTIDANLDFDINALLQNVDLGEIAKLVVGGVSLSLNGAGDDDIYGGNSFDFIVGGDGIDDIYGRNGTNVVFGDDFDVGPVGDALNIVSELLDPINTLKATANPITALSLLIDIITTVYDALSGSDGNNADLNDSYQGGTGTDIVFGGGGSDDLDGGAGFDLLVGGDGDDFFKTDPGESFQPQPWHDTAWGGPGDDTFQGSAGNDLIGSSLGGDIFFGGDGNDGIFGGDASDQIYGEGGDDWLYGEGGDDILAGGLGDDTITGGPGGDMMLASLGSDTITDLAAEDTFGNEVGIDGTADANNIIIIFGTTTHSVFVDGVQTNYDASLVTHFVIDGQGGDDQLQVTGTSDEENIQLRAGALKLTSDTHAVYATDFEDIDVFAAVEDTAQFLGTLGDDTFIARGHKPDAYMFGSGYHNYVRGAGRNTADAGSGGIDEAIYFDTPADDLYTTYADTNEASIVGGGLETYALGFDFNKAFSQAGGSDDAMFYDSLGDDRYLARGHEDDAYILGNGQVNRAIGFATNSAIASAGGIDRGFYFDTLADDTFTGQGETNTSTISGGGYFASGQGFTFNKAYSVNGGTNEARFEDSSGDDVYIARGFANDAYMFGGDFYVIARWFGDNAAVSSHGGDDTGFYYDTIGNDTFTTDATTGRATLTNGVFRATGQGFARNEAYAGRGGTDAAIFFDTAGNDAFTVRAYKPDAWLSGAGFYNYAMDFAINRAEAIRGGVDDALFIDSAGNDTFLARAALRQAQLNGGGATFIAADFDTNRGFALRGGDDDQVVLENVRAVDTVLGSGNIIEITNDAGWSLTGSTFESVEAQAAPGETPSDDGVDNTITYAFATVGTWL